MKHNGFKKSSIISHLCTSLYCLESQRQVYAYYICFGLQSLALCFDRSTACEKEANHTRNCGRRREEYFDKPRRRIVSFCLWYYTKTQQAAVSERQVATEAVTPSQWIFHSLLHLWAPWCCKWIFSPWMVGNIMHWSSGKHWLKYYKYWHIGLYSILKIVPIDITTDIRKVSKLAVVEYKFSKILIFT